MKYPNLFSPVRLGNTGIILKNRLEIGPSTPVFIQGPESYPSERMIRYYANLAKNGASLITVHICKSDGSPAKPTTENNVISGHMMGMDIFDTKCAHYMTHLAEAVHFHNSRLIVRMSCAAPEGYDIANILSRYIPHNIIERHMNKEMSKEMLLECAKKTTAVCKRLQECGFDGVFLHASYELSLIGRCLSKKTNIRKDEFGGEKLENRCRFPLYLCKEIKKACGNDFIIEMSITGYSEIENGEWSLDDTIKFMELADGYIDIVQLRCDEIDHAHPTGYEPKKRPFTYMAIAAKKANTSALVSTIGGNFTPEDSEKIISEGKADLIGMARGWISNPEYGQLLLENKEDELVPCIRCNKCILASNNSTFASVCSVNPRYCINDRLDYLISPIKRKKKVAVIGGGPAGIEAAICAFKRGHEVVLYEKNNRLGGQLRIAGIADFKWPLKNYTDYLVNKAYQTGFTIHLNTAATHNLIEKENYDVVIVAIGAKPLIPPIEGIEQSNVLFTDDAYLHEDKIGNEVIIIGGGEVGVETALHLNGHGKKTTVIEKQSMLMPDTSFEHYYYLVECEWKKRKNFTIHVDTKVEKIEENSVICEKKGKKLKISADTIIISSGYVAKTEEAFQFAKSAPQYFYIGDCQKARSLQSAIRDGFSIGSSI